MKITHRAIAAIACGLLFTPGIHAANSTAGHWIEPTSGETWKNETGECWKNPNFSKAAATKECEPDMLPKPKPKPKPVAKPAAAPAPRVVIEEVSLSADTHFGFDSDELRTEGVEEVSELADRVRNVNGLGIEVAGHADSTGSEDYNLDLSMRRAASVKKALVEDGIDPSVITTRGYGETVPLVPNTTSENRAKNRRVNITVTGTKKIKK